MIQRQKIGKEFGSIMNLLKRRMSTFDMAEDGADSDSNAFTAKQGLVLGYIAKNNCEGKDVFQKDIEKEFSIRRSTATGILQLMEKNGFVVREAVKEDARLKKLVLTEKAKQRQQRFIKYLDEITTLAFDGVTEEELETLESIMNKVKKNLEEK